MIKDFYYEKNYIKGVEAKREIQLQRKRIIFMMATQGSSLEESNDDGVDEISLMPIRDSNIE